MKKIDLMHAMFGKNHAHKCGECNHLCEFGCGNKTLFKCEIYGVTHSEASDWRKSYLACGLFNMPYPYTGSPIMRLVEPEKDDSPIEGQLDLFGGD